jgi:hypothetical protein
MTTLTALEGRELVFSDGSRLTPPDWLAVHESPEGVILNYTDARGKKIGTLRKFGDARAEVDTAIGWLVRHHETHGSEVSAT